GVSTKTRAGVVDGYFHIVVDLHTVVPDRDVRWFSFLLTVELWGTEINVVTLPDRRRFTGIDKRCGDFVDAAAIIVLTVQSVTVQDLHFIAALHIDTTIPACLALGFRHKWHPKLDVQPEMSRKGLVGAKVAALHLHDAAVTQHPLRR